MRNNADSTPAEPRYNVTQWGIENMAGALMHGTLADDPVAAWSKFRGVTGLFSPSVAELVERGYIAVRVAFVRLGPSRFTKRGDQ